MKRIVNCCFIGLYLAFLGGFSGCDAFKSWFDTTANQTVIAPKERANLTKLTVDMQTIQRAIEVFHAQHGRYPESLTELTQKGILHRIPREPFGGEWLYDQFSGTVKSSSHPDLVSD